MAVWPTVTDDDGSGTTGTILDNAFFNSVRDYVGDAWTGIAFNSGNFTGSGTITWTVASGDQVAYAYTVKGKSVTLSWFINTTTVAGTGVELRLAIPAGMTSLRSVRTTYFYSDAGTEGIGLAWQVPGEAFVRLFKSSTVSNWSAATNTTIVAGQITFEIS
jgi:hypothetical protein